MKQAKLVLAQAVLWAAAILAVALVEERSADDQLLAVLATLSL